MAGVVSDLANWLVVTPGGVLTGGGDVPMDTQTLHSSKQGNYHSLHYYITEYVHICTEYIFKTAILSSSYTPYSLVYQYIAWCHSSHLYPTPVRYSTCSGSPSARSDPQPPQIQKLAHFLVEQSVNYRPLRGPDKIVIPLYFVLHPLACESGFSCIGASISCQAVAAPPPLGLGSCTTMDLRPPHWIAIATTHSPNHPVYNVSRILTRYALFF